MLALLGISYGLIRSLIVDYKRIRARDKKIQAHSKTIWTRSEKFYPSCTIWEAMDFDRNNVKDSGFWKKILLEAQD